jgi:hypothetical protein
VGLRKNGRRKDIPIDYVRADPNGNRRSRRLAAREAKAARLGRDAGTPTGGAPVIESYAKKNGKTSEYNRWLDER